MWQAFNLYSVLQETLKKKGKEKISDAIKSGKSKIIRFVIILQVSSLWLFSVLDF